MAPQAAYLCLQRTRRVLEAMSQMSRVVAILALTLPLSVVALATVECWDLKRHQRECDQSSKAAEVVQSIATAAFAWLATPPQ